MQCQNVEFDGCSIAALGALMDTLLWSSVTFLDLWFIRDWNLIGFHNIWYLSVFKSCGLSVILDIMCHISCCIRHVCFMSLVTHISNSPHSPSQLLPYGAYEICPILGNGWFQRNHNVWWYYGDTRPVDMLSTRLMLWACTGEGS